MSSSLEAIEAEVLKLTPAERFVLMERLFSILDADPALDQAWDAEAARRDAEIESGSTTEIPGPEAINRVRNAVR